MLAKAYKKWGRKGDIALVALNNNNKEIIGVTWVRLFTKNNPSYGFIDNKTPDMAIAVKAEFRGKGIGTQLLKKLIYTVKESGFKGISLSIDPRNKALRLYKRLGFKIYKQERVDNHIYLLNL
jgi:ribosomal protein S18 acetylase RimI-like enzyme